jgi:hypothetical protein
MGISNSEMNSFLPDGQAAVSNIINGAISKKERCSILDLQNETKNSGTVLGCVTLGNITDFRKFSLRIIPSFLCFLTVGLE